MAGKKCVDFNGGVVDLRRLLANYSVELTTAKQLTHFVTIGHSPITSQPCCWCDKQPGFCTERRIQNGRPLNSDLGNITAD